MFSLATARLTRFRCTHTNHISELYFPTVDLQYYNQVGERWLTKANNYNIFAAVAKFWISFAY